jgi:hypothetical protein
MLSASGFSEQLSVWSKERMRAVEIADRNLMGNNAAKSLAWKPGVEMKGRRLDLERRLAQFCQVQIDGVIWCWTNRRWDTGEHRQDRAMNVAGSDQLRARMAFDDGGKLAGIEEKLAVHVCDAGLEWRMVQEQERGPFR